MKSPQKDVKITNPYFGHRAGETLFQFQPAKSVVAFFSLAAILLYVFPGSLILGNSGCGERILIKDRTI